MKTENCRICGIPATVYGDYSEKVFLFVHGKHGNRTEGGDFALTVCEMGYQVVSIDLPEHGERKSEPGFVPWRVIPELREVMKQIKKNHSLVSLRANSIGAWFCMQSFAEEKPERCLFVSPLIDMKKLIEGMMQAAGVTERQLASEQEIKTDFGETLSMKYLDFAREHPIEVWHSPTSILYAGHDELTCRTDISVFAESNGLRLTVMEDGEHWFHTPKQLDFLHSWTVDEVSR